MGYDRSDSPQWKSRKLKGDKDADELEETKRIRRKDRAGDVNHTYEKSKGRRASADDQPPAYTP